MRKLRKLPKLTKFRNPYELDKTTQWEDFEYFPQLELGNFYDFQLLQERDTHHFDSNLSKISPKERTRWYKSLTKKNPSKKKRKKK